MVRFVVHFLRPAASPLELVEGIFAVHAHKTAADDPLGIVLHNVGHVGHDSIVHGPAVTELTAGSPLHGSIRCGDVVLSVNGHAALGATRTGRQLREAVGQVIIIVSRSMASPVRHVCLKGEPSFGISIKSSVDVAMAPVVIELEPASTLARNGVRVGDTLLAVNGRPAMGASDGSRLLRESSEAAQVVVTVLDHGKQRGEPRKLLHHPNLASAVGTLDESTSWVTAAGVPAAVDMIEKIDSSPSILEAQPVGSDTCGVGEYV